MSCSRSICCLMWNITRNLCRLLHGHLLVPAVSWTTKEAALRGHGNGKLSSGTLLLCCPLTLKVSLFLCLSVMVHIRLSASYAFV